MPKQIDLDIINLRVNLSRELCQFTEKSNQIRRQAAPLAEDHPNKIPMIADADNIDIHIAVLEEALDALDAL